MIDVIGFAEISLLLAIIMVLIGFLISGFILFLVAKMFSIKKNSYGRALLISFFASLVLLLFELSTKSVDNQFFTFFGEIIISIIIYTLLIKFVFSVDWKEAILVWLVNAIISFIVFFILNFLFLIIGASVFHLMGLADSSDSASDTFMPKVGMLNPPFYINSFSIDTSEVNLGVRNNGGAFYRISKISIDKCGEEEFDVVLAPSEAGNFLVYCSKPLRKGEAFRGDVVIYYSNSDNDIILTSNGSIQDNVS
jgi:hypothetical protein